MLTAADLAKRARIVHPIQRKVVQRMPANIEVRRDLADLRVRHYLALRIPFRNVESGFEAVAREELRCSKICWVAVVDAKTQVTRLFRHTPYFNPSGIESRAGLEARILYFLVRVIRGPIQVLNRVTSALRLACRPVSIGHL